MAGKITVRSAIWTGVRILLSLGAAFAGGYLLYRFEYLSQIRSVDNVVGLIPVALVVSFVVGFCVLVWMRHTKKRAPFAVAVAAVVLASAVLFPNALRGNWWIQNVNAEAGSDGDISGYAPFTEGSLTAKLGEPSSLVLQNDLPVLDGALALYPVYAAVAETVYSEQAYRGEAMFTNTVKAFEALIAGERDIIFTAYASQSQLAAAEKAGADLRFTAIGREAFVFIAGKSNPVESVTVQQIRNIYSGKTAKWATLGWKEGGRIIAFQRPEGSGSQTGLQSVMRGLPIQVPQPLPSASLIGSNSLMQQVSAEWRGVQPALGYSYRFFANTMLPNPNAKFLKVNGVEPSIENIQSGAYPFVVNFYAVTNGEAQGNVKKVIDWLLSPQGQSLIEKTGYAPL